ncbi:helix-turn-helix domain-containing protein [Serratia sp. J2]|uniref:AlbA family DNA-binding domain-containing protein n=1 Tax=Serratia sp. J2 TaxID=3386551 RepID=UPI003917004D
MLSEALLEELRYRGEGSDLDYKSERYNFSRKVGDEEKSEMLKDILALANTHREGTAYILMGFKENPPHPAEVVGLSKEGVIDDSRLQEFVNGKLETKLTFRYEERLFDGKHIAVISIPKQQRPFYLKRDFGKLSKDTVYVRRGSSTGIASPREIAMMGAANLARGDAQVTLVFQTAENQLLPYAFEKSFLNFPDDLPDFEQRNSGMFSVGQIVNRDYWRDCARYHSSSKRLIQVRLSLSNQSDFSLRDVYLEITCCCAEGGSMSLLRADDLPQEPDSELRLDGISSFLEHAKRQMRVDEQGSEPVVHATLGTVRPGQTIRTEEDLAILPSGPGNYVLYVRIFANEIPNPILFEHLFSVSGKVMEKGIVDLNQLNHSALSGNDD